MIEDPSGRFMPLSRVVYSWLMDIQENESRFEQGLHWAIEGYDDLNYSVNIDYKVKKVPISSFKAVVWPKDLVIWLRMWVLIGNKWFVFTNNPSVPLGAKENLDTLPELHKAPSGPNVYFPTINSHGEDLGRFFGVRAYNDGVGYYTEHPQEREFQLSSRIVNSGYVYLEYISDGVDPNKDTMVPKTSMQVLKSYMHWKDTEHSPNPNKQRLAPNKERLYYNELDKFLAIEIDFSLDDIAEAFWDSYTMLPKY